MIGFRILDACETNRPSTYQVPNSKISVRHLFIRNRYPIFVSMKFDGMSPVYDRLVCLHVDNIIANIVYCGTIQTQLLQYRPLSSDIYHLQVSHGHPILIRSFKI